MRRRDVPMTMPDLVLRLFRLGVTISQLAGVFDCSPQRIEDALRKAGRP